MSGALSFGPLIPWQIVAALSIISLALLALSVARGGRGVIGRGVALTALALAVLNPSLVDEVRQPQDDIALLVVDDSDSQRVGGRQGQSEAAVEAVRSSLARFPGLQTRIVRAGPNMSGEKKADGGTRLFAALSQAMTRVPSGRFAGAVMITDGQVHDVPAAPFQALPPGPVHVLLSGGRGESDRRLVIEKAPGYGITGNRTSIAYRVEEQGLGRAAKGKTARVRLKIDGREVAAADTAIGESQHFAFILEHAGPTVVELEVEPAENELSPLNNHAAISVNGVRDRLRVLLVSGRPHSGERAWRNLLKSDPMVDLVHFTILRPPEKADFTPLNELSLIVFPIQELFEAKLKEFDLIVFDRYSMLDVLPPAYLRNIRNYLSGGGAILLASGPEFAGRKSLFKTTLGAVMPAKPTGKIMNSGFAPQLTAIGRRHPVTASLAGAGGAGETPRWGRWFRQVQAEVDGGDTLMTGPGDNPILALGRIGEGRMAQLMSDHIWLWQRGFEGGGPHGELMRRIAHWLMKEPDLEEESLKARVDEGRLFVERRSLAIDAPHVTVTSPSGEKTTLGLEESGDGAAVAEAAAAEAGLYRVEDGVRTALAAAGALNPLEYADLRASADILAPVLKASGGAAAWIEDGFPDFRHTAPGRDTAGRGWMGVKRNGAYVVAGVRQAPLLSGLLILLLVLGGLAAAWLREGR